MKPDDETLVRECLQGDRKAFETLLERYEKKVFNVALRMVSDPDDARDVAQNAFLKAFERLAGFNPAYKFYNWIYRIAINESLNLLAKRKRVQPIDEQLVSGERSPADLLRGAELSRTVQRALMTLKPDYRTVIVLRHFHECSYRDMSAILDIPEKTVKSRLFSARQLLRDALSSKGIREP